jgi:hypothetical protein
MVPLAAFGLREEAMRHHRAAGAAIAATLILIGPVSAEEQTLKFRLVTHVVSGEALAAPNVAGTTVSANKAVGVAVFEDGRIAFKHFVNTETNTADNGEFTGFSTYTFENGDAITARFAGDWSAEGIVGDYEVLSGAGAYEGVTGAGHFESADAAWGDANLFDGSFTLEVPGS